MGKRGPSIDDKMMGPEPNFHGVTFKNASEISDYSFSLPVGPHLRNDQINYIIKKLNYIINKLNADK